MRKKYKTGLKFTGFLLSITLLVLCSYLIYLKDVEENSPLVVVLNGLSVNYLDGVDIPSTNEEKTYNFSVTNNTNNDLQYKIVIEDIKNDGVLKYDLVEKNDKIKILQEEVTKSDLSLAREIKISPSETNSYTLTIHENTIPSKLNVSIEENTDTYFASIIKNDNEIKDNSESTWGRDVATSNEGLIKTKSDDGSIYYFRGNVLNNYVVFANLKWRIVRINNDETVRLVLDDVTDSSSSYYEDNSDIPLKEKLDFSKNKLSTNLNNWYQQHLEEYDSYINSNKYCLDDSIFKEEESRTTYLGNPRILGEFNESNSCLGTTYTSRIGILSADEVISAGASSTLENQSYYLYLPNITNSWWTLTPSFSEAERINFFEVNNSGKISDTAVGSYYRSVRPVINLIKKVTATGKGTINDPYVIKLT